MRAFVLGLCAALLAASAGAAAGFRQGADSLALSFGSYHAVPVVLTHIGIEGPAQPLPPAIVATTADAGPPRTSGVNALSVPRDVGRDGKWRVSVQWVELLTDRAWQAEVEVPVHALTVDYGAYALNLIFGPEGMLLIGSDRAGNQPGDRVDVAVVCGRRMPAADRRWRNAGNELPGLSAVLAMQRPAVGTTRCPVEVR
ncbi:MAG: hypothetical protein Q4G25_04240 [Paracoccus sp. (in: a-proteobacteria)]|nr:hypothetical protein [Paracoccus sp. (in: a-proteobacteria)]